MKLGILGSGKGTNAAAIADACLRGEIPAEVAVVISDVADAGILERARERGLSAKFIAPGKFRTKLDDEAEKACIQTLKDAGVELVVLAGFMRILKGEFLADIRSARCQYSSVVVYRPFRVWRHGSRP